MPKRGPRVRTFKDKLDIPLDEFEWSAHERRCLRRANLRTVRDVLRTTAADLGRVPGFGGATLYSIKSFLKEMGYELPEGRPKADGRPELVAVNMPPAEAAQIKGIQWRHVRHLLRQGGDGPVRFLNRSEVMRGGLAALAGLPAAELERVFAHVPQLRRGRLSDAEADIEAKVKKRRTEGAGVRIDYVLSKFDFEGVADMLARLGWEWEFEAVGGRKARRVPSAADLERVAEELLQRALEGEDEVAYGGLYVNNVDGGYRLMFVLGYQDAERGATPIKEQLNHAGRGREGRGRMRRAS